MKIAPRDGSKVLVAYDFRDGIEGARGMAIMWWDGKIDEFPWDCESEGGRVREDFLVGWKKLPKFPRKKNGVYEVEG